MPARPFLSFNLMLLMARSILLVPAITVMGPLAEPGPTDGQIKYLDLKPGAWDVTMHTSVTGVLTPVTDAEVQKATVSMNAEQRAQWTAALRAREKKIIETAKNGSDKKSTSCPLKQNFETNPQGQFYPPQCTAHTDSSGQQLHATITCLEGNSYSAWKQISDFRRIDDENFTGTIVVSAKNDDKTDRVVTETFVGKWVTGSCGPTPPPTLMAASVSRSGNDYSTHVANLSTVPMTAYSITVSMYGSNAQSRHFYDSRMVGDRPIQPRGSKQEDRAGIVLGAKPIAAIFSDGSTFGDTKEIAAIMARRADRLKGLTAAAAVLCNAQEKNTDREAVLVSLEDRKSKLPNLGASMANEIQQGAIADVILYMKRPVRGHNATIRETLEYVQNSAATLADDPIKDGGGDPYVKPSDARLSCSE
jgi:hypothetical protein